MARFGSHSTSGLADANGNWRIVLPPQKASSEARNLEIRSGSEQVILRDVLVGEVWLCSGQSNMDFPLAKAVGGKQEAAQAKSFPSIRLMNLTGTHRHDLVAWKFHADGAVNTAVTATYGVAGLKYAADVLGYQGGQVRCPLLPSTDSEKAAIDEILKKAGMF